MHITSICPVKPISEHRDRLHWNVVNFHLFLKNLGSCTKFVPMQGFMQDFVLEILPILQWLDFTQNFMDLPSCWGGLGACAVKIMILEVRFLLTNFDSTSTMFKI